MRFIFAGTTEFGIPTIEKLMKDHELVFVITQPDKPTGRKQELSPTPIKTWAVKKNIQVLTPGKINEAAEEIQNANVNVLLVAAYGQIIPKEILEIPHKGSVNIHGSILPKYRGASPIQAAILAGDKTTGITLIQMDEKMDHGPIIATKETKIGNQSFVELYKTMAELAANLTADVLPNFVGGNIKPKEQDHTKATFTKLLTRDDARIDWTKSAHEILNQIRALNPEPGTWTTLDGKNIKILDAKISSDMKIELPGKLYRLGNGIAVKTPDQSLEILKVLPEGKKLMTGSEFSNGLKNLDRQHFV